MTTPTAVSGCEPGLSAATLAEASHPPNGAEGTFLVLELARGNGRAASLELAIFDVAGVIGAALEGPKRSGVRGG